jgi:hypothetical protein
LKKEKEKKEKPQEGEGGETRPTMARVRRRGTSLIRNRQPSWDRHKALDKSLP